MEPSEAMLAELRQEILARPDGRQLLDTVMRYIEAQQAQLENFGAEEGEEENRPVRLIKFTTQMYQ